MFEAGPYLQALDEDRESWPAMADVCSVSSGEILGSDLGETSGTFILGDYANDVDNCGKLVGVGGPDGFLAIELGAGEVVHVKAQPRAPGGQPALVDLGLYVLQDCNPSACLKRVDRCPEGHAEEIVWSADGPGVFYFGVDSRPYDPSAEDVSVDVTVDFPRCGNGVLEAGEGCDDKNAVAGDGCTPSCRAELPVGGVQVPEVEPNSDYLAANELLLGAGEAMTVQGVIGGSCDLDFFLVSVPEDGFVRATILDGNGQPCGQDAPKLTLELDDPSGRVELGAGITSEANGCPHFDETTFNVGRLPAGKYLLELKPPDQGVGGGVFKYKLQVEVLAPAGGAGG